ncbi:unnamed protein product [Protopolystoma xenopodis]|uniref:Uncharacterized protein n=1 Tax=Protopolystoma xenopodis TaxID=117903 RepID=A0A3S5CKU5_9PLAT|nr:unnamed protein product [Protopolystoma xenopodis]
MLGCRFRRVAEDLELAMVGEDLYAVGWCDEARRGTCWRTCGRLQPGLVLRRGETECVSSQRAVIPPSARKFADRGAATAGTHIVLVANGFLDPLSWTQGRGLRKGYK